MTEDKRRIRILCDTDDPPTLLAALTLGAPADAVDFRIERIPGVSGAIADPNTLIAIIAATSAAIGCLTASVFAFAIERNKKIILQGASGRRIEIPVGVSEQEAEHLVRLARELDVESIRLVSDQAKPSLLPGIIRNGAGQSIFICYRRLDSQWQVDKIYDRLVREFSSQTIFRDLDNIHPGEAFPSIIRETLEAARAVLVVIGANWLGTMMDGSRRIDDEDDYVRIEIETALKAGVLIIPLLVHPATMPSPRQLPDSIRSLATLSASSIRPAPDFERDMDRVVMRLQQIGILSTIV